jgi:diguanylate cyclase (GGDEF)-like protein
VLRDDAGNVWMNTTRGLERYAPDGSLAYFNMDTGLFGDEGCVHAALKAADGNLYFGVVPGLVELLHEPAGAVQRPVLVVDPPLVNGSPRSLPPGTRLRHDQNTLEFRYVCPATSRESPVIYKTRLFPFDRDWSRPGRERSVRYTNLPAGTYTFSVLASSGVGSRNWFGPGQRLIFTIVRPFWQSGWFRALELLLGAGLLALVVGARIRVLQRQKKRLEAVVQERTNEIAEKNRELARLSITDPLTGLKNRRFIDETIREDMSIIRRELHNVRGGRKPFDERAAQLGVFMIDVDHFKRVNDAHGHEAGDAVIVEIARRLQAMMRQSDTVARWGGEEFLVVTRQSRQADAYPLAERIRQTIELEEFTVPSGLRLKETVSIGYCHFPFLSSGQETLSWHQVVAMADSALYLAKHNGRNLVIGIHPGPAPFDGEGQELLADLDAAARNGFIEMACRKPVRVPPHP